MYSWKIFDKENSTFTKHHNINNDSDAYAHFIRGII